MARHEGNFRGSAEEPLGIDELMALLSSIGTDDVPSRNAAIACALSASEGWQEAVKRLGGAFAEDGPGLSKNKDELPGD